MTYDDLIDQLNSRQALIVHFSHHANTREGGVFPTDLQNARLNSRSWPLSCCLVWPEHQMALPGSVGIILRPCSLPSIIGVLADDSGSPPDLDDAGFGEPLSQATFDRSFEVAAGKYNEWRLRNADVTGIYWEATAGHIYAKKRTILADPDTGAPIGDDIMMQSIQLSEVLETFSDLPIFTRSGGQIVQCEWPG